MKKVYAVLRDMFGSKPSKDQLLVWAKTEYGKDWRFAYQHMLDNKGLPPKVQIDFHNQNDNLKGWI